MTDRKKLLNTFPPISTTEWEKKIFIDLKGADYSKKLIWKTLEGIDVKPYYRKENLKDLDYLNTAPGCFPFTRSINNESNDWEIRQDIFVSNIIQSNKKALNILNRGVSSLCFITNELIKTQKNINELLNNIHIECIELNFLSGQQTIQIVEKLLELIKERNINSNILKGSFNYDTLGELTITGDFYNNEKEDFNHLKKLIELCDTKLPNYRVINVNGQYFKNAGASIVQELAFSLSMGAEYLQRLTELELPIDKITSKIKFTFATGSNYFLEIAKLRAARFLWAKITKAFMPNSNKSAAMQIHSVTQEWNKTIYDINVNILRATTESMSAVLGGTNSLSVQPFDKNYMLNQDFSERIATNIQLILKEEAFFDKTVDPSAGSYYIENITKLIIDASWDLFLQIDKKGGYIEAFKSYFVQENIERTAELRKNNINNRKEILLGTNQYANTEEEKKETKIISPSVKSSKKTAIAKPLFLFRGAEEFEQLRLSTEKLNKVPKVFLLNYGNLTMQKARASFSTNFFACAGFEVIDNLCFNNIEEGVQEAIITKADIVVICSSDEENIVSAPKAAELLHGKAVFVVAGYPKEIDKLKDVGIEHFIHVRSNVLEELKKFQRLVTK